MKIKGIILISALVLLASCASLRKGSSSISSDRAASSTPKVQPKVEVNTPPEPTIAVREEKVRNIDINEPDYNYYVIIGSFQSLNNARNFSTQLINQGFTPTILESEIGFFRVSVAAYNEEQPTRTRVGQIRNQYPVYNDVWLLKKKK